MAKRSSTKRNATVEDLKQQSHYTDLTYEPIEVIHDWVEDPASYLKGNVIKYLGRHKTKGQLTDLRKAQVYLEWLIGELET